MRQKQSGDALADIRPNSGMNHTYQAYFEALLAPNNNDQQHSTDKAAVVKYIRRRERRRRAEENRKSYEITNDVLEKVFSKKNYMCNVPLLCLANSRINGENGRCGY